MQCAWNQINHKGSCVCDAIQSVCWTHSSAFFIFFFVLRPLFFVFYFLYHSSPGVCVCVLPWEFAKISLCASWTRRQLSSIYTMQICRRKSREHNWKTAINSHIFWHAKHTGRCVYINISLALSFRWVAVDRRRVYKHHQWIYATTAKHRDAATNKIHAWMSIINLYVCVCLGLRAHSIGNSLPVRYYGVHIWIALSGSVFIHSNFDFFYSIVRVGFRECMCVRWICNCRRSNNTIWCALRENTANKI